MEKSARILNKILKTMISILVLTMVALVFFNVVLRYAFNSGITWSEEMSRYIFVWIVFLGAIVAYKEKAHLGVDLLVGALPRLGQKILYVINNIIVIGVLVIIIIGGIKMIEVTKNSFGPATGTPVSVLFIASLIAAISMIGLSILQTINFVAFDKDVPPWAKPKLSSEKEESN
jgi:TRAP-type C4-dicarboxylate transport system permease small subunit